MAKWIAILAGRGPDPAASLARLEALFVKAFGDGDVVRATLSTIEERSVGSNLRRDMIAADGLLEAWLIPGVSSNVLSGWLATEAAAVLDAGHGFDVHENVVVPAQGQASGRKRITFIRRLDGTTPAQFADHWMNIHAPMARDLPHLRAYTQNLFVVGPPDKDAVLDGMADMRFDDNDAVAAFGSPVGQRLVADTPSFCGGATSFTMREHVLFDHAVA